MTGLSGTRHVILVFDNVPLIDQTGAFSVEDTIEQLQSRGVRVHLVHPSPEIREKLERIATRPEVIRDVYYDTLGAALAAVAAQANGGKPAG